MFGIIHKIFGATAKYVGTEFLNHLFNFAFASVHGPDKSLEVTPVLFWLAYIGHHDLEEFFIKFATLIKLAWSEPNTFLVDLNQCPR